MKTNRKIPMVWLLLASIYETFNLIWSIQEEWWYLAGFNAICWLIVISITLWALIQVMKHGQV